MNERKKLIIIFGIVALLALAVVLAKTWVAKEPEAQQQTEVDNYIPSRVDKVTSVADEYITSGLYDKAIYSIDAGLAEDFGPDDRYQLYLKKGQACFSKKDYNCSLESYQAAQKIDDTGSALSGIAASYEAQANIEPAIASYEKLIEYFIETDESSEAVELINNKLKVLKEQL